MKLPDQDILKKQKEIEQLTVEIPDVEPLGLIEELQERNRLLAEQNEENKKNAVKSHRLNIFMAIMAGLSFLASIVTIIISAVH